MEQSELSAQCTGQSMSHLQEVFPGHFLHRDVVDAYLPLVEQAAKEGIALRLASGFRSFERQLSIWNAKARGERPVVDSEGKPVAMAALSERDQVLAILRWSALPGASRHHWGSDMDVWDSAAVSDDYQLQLTPDEYAPGGPFYRCSLWLDGVIHRGETDFFRPYNGAKAGGVAAEPWHLSYRPLAAVCEKALTLEVLRKLIENTDICLQGAILDDLDEIYSRFITL
ncbi:MAG: M15 family metallopeptidase [Gammaproteobacteria bacterium]|nr:M15 family metallopeptidase [Gammaproteobacteria bacterium]MBQ0839612.1 M15 family metallopeptidase [Gammaproteobacteria bacterium]